MHLTKVADIKLAIVTAIGYRPDHSNSWTSYVILATSSIRSAVVATVHHTIVASIDLTKVSTSSPCIEKTPTFEDMRTILLR